MTSVMPFLFVWKDAENKKSAAFPESTEYCRIATLLCFTLFADCCTLSHQRVKNLFPNPDVSGSYL